MKPIVSVIMPAHNAESFIESSIESVIQQSFRDWELVIVNDASSDLTSTIAQKYLIDPRVRLISLENNMGAAKARNIGCAEANGNYLAFLDSDDLWIKSKLWMQVNFHRMNTKIAISHTNYVHLLPNGKTRRRVRNALTPQSKKSGLLFPMLLYHNCIGTLTVMIRKDLFDQYEGFDPTITGGTEDWDLWLRISEGKYNIGYLNTCLAMYRINPEGISKKNIIRYKKSLIVILEKHLQSVKPRQSIRNNSYANIFLITGLTYYRSGNYKMAELYLFRAIKLKPKDMILLCQLLYYFIMSCILQRHSEKTTSYRYIPQ